MNIMLRYIAISLLGASGLLAQCQAIAPARPRIYFPSAGYGSYATLKDRWLAAKAANTAQFQALTTQASAYAAADPAATYYDDVAFEQAFLYALDPTTFAAYGPRSLYFLAKAQVDKAPGVFITAATNANPVVFTAVGHGLTTSMNQVTVWGGTGSWAAVNKGQWSGVIRIDADHFSIPVDSTSFGALAGNLTVQVNRLVNRDPGRWNAPNWAAVWDWAHDQIATALTANQAALIQHAMEGAVQYHSTTFASANIGGVANLVVGPMNGALQMAVALSGDASGMDTACTLLRTRFLAVVPPAYTTGGTFGGFPVWPLAHGGAMVESTEYAPEVIFYLLTYLEAMQGATGEDLTSLLGSTFLADQMKGFAQMVSPSNASSGGNWKELYPYGDIIKANQHTNTLNGIARQCVQLLAYHAARLGDTTTAAYAQWWLQNTFTAAQLTSMGNFTVTPALNAPSEFVFYDPNLSATDYTTAYGLDWYADGLGLVLSKSSTASIATWVGMKAGALRAQDEDHFHADLLGFSIYRKGDWLTNELQGWGNNFYQTKFHNTVWPTTNQPDTRSGSNAPTSPQTNGMTAVASVTRQESAGDGSYFYAQGDATPAYRGNANAFTSPAYTPTITAVLRDLLFLKPDVVVVADRLAYSSATTAKWMIQALGDPGTPSGSAFTLPSLLSTQELRVSVVHPPAPTLTVVSPSTQTTEAGTTSGNVASQWRIEMSTGASVTSEQYLVVMQAGDSGFTPMTVTALAASNLRAGQFTGNVVAALTDTATSGVTRSYTFTSSGTVRHRVLGLLPSTAYAVDRSTPGTVIITDSGGAGGNITTTAGGLLVFDTNSAPGGSVSGGAAVAGGSFVK